MFGNSRRRDLDVTERAQIATPLPKFIRKQATLERFSPYMYFLPLDSTITAIQEVQLQHRAPPSKLTM